MPFMVRAIMRHSDSFGSTRLTLCGFHRGLDGAQRADDGSSVDFRKLVALPSE